jgi:hypothetical protein
MNRKIKKGVGDPKALAQGQSTRNKARSTKIPAVQSR